MILTSLLFTFVLIKFNNNIKSEKEKFNFLSVEGLILFLLFALVAITIIVIIGTFYPIISEAITAQKKTVGHPFFNKTTGPFFITIILLLGFLPFINLKNSSKIILVLSLLAGTVTIIFVYFKIQTHPGAWASYGASVFALLSVIYHFYKGIKKYANQHSKSVFMTLIKSPVLLPKRFGVFITHLGVVLTAVGIVSSYGFQKKQEFKVKKTESVKFNGYEITHNGLFEKRTPLFDEVEAHLLFKSSNGKTRELKPKIRFYHYWEQPSTEMDVMPLLTGDIYAIIQGWEKDETLYFQIFYNPLIQLVWIGSFLIFLGPIIILTIRREKQ
jgi:cytochrome c-type biogenesis protein CcmF